MPTHVHEIFNSKAMNKNRTGAYNREPVEPAQLLKKKSMAPLPPMGSKFGGYKPKILAEEQILPTDTQTNSPRRNTAPGPPRPVIQLTKPKPFIIGDKDVPMVLSTVGDYDDDSKETEGQMENLSIYETFDEEDDDELENSRIEAESKVNDQNGNVEYNTKQNGFTDESVNDQIKPDPTLNSQTSSSPTTPVKSNYRLSVSMLQPDEETENDPNLEDVEIPLPDYDEDELTMTFEEEDPDELVQRRANANMRDVHPVRSASTVKQYHGADLSHFLEDDEEGPVRPPPSGRRKSKNGNVPNKDYKVKEKHSMFKPQQKRGNTTQRKKSQNKSKRPGSNFRTFSYADSKLGTKEKGLNKQQKFTEFSDDSETFLSSNDGTYESFLRSRHGEAMSPQSCDSGIDMYDWREKIPENTFWKKLTVRLKHKIHKGGH